MEALSRFLTVWTDEWDHQDPDLIDGYLELCSEGEEVLDEIRARGQTAKFETLGYPQVSHTVYNV